MKKPAVISKNFTVFYHPSSCALISKYYNVKLHGSMARTIRHKQWLSGDKFRTYKVLKHTHDMTHDKKYYFTRDSHGWIIRRILFSISSITSTKIHDRLQKTPIFLHDFKNICHFVNDFRNFSDETKTKHACTRKIA